MYDASSTVSTIQKITEKNDLTDTGKELFNSDFEIGECTQQVAAKQIQVILEHRTDYKMSN
ncbi:MULTISPECIES: hypothetical protein [Candidatus Williamhamiltonella]|uniref:Uncharacterized protein n=1 Tax=Candidatus Williamhamiltonella defendens TaxID=138072 RepID=A0A2D3TCC1_9ENTR|nr:hypothetical protein [Candidatus Hamiltonella defensa]ATW33354.1 hypothetical protein BJP43_02640 [Candidatus Hamiltonella defensa]AYB49479.1 hypothetical protein CJJ19_08435 [Candidatus Hamiltonella defensa]